MNWLIDIADKYLIWVSAFGFWLYLMIKIWIRVWIRIVKVSDFTEGYLAYMRNRKSFQQWQDENRKPNE